MKIVPQSAELLFITPNAAQFLEVAGRTCYRSEDKITPTSAAAFIKMLIHEKGHESVIEHASATFRVVCDRGVSHEIVRHRIASYSQESTRYCNYSKEKFGAEITVIEPPGLPPALREEWFCAMRAIEQLYMDMLEAKVPPQIARAVLPTCLKTEIVITYNFREWRHFLKLRTSKAAHPQMREVAGMISEILVRECPEVFEVLDREARRISLTEKIFGKLKDMCSHLNQPEANNDVLELASLYEEYEEAA